jgi:hypothetical protein
LIILLLLFEEINFKNLIEKIKLIYKNTEIKAEYEKNIGFIYEKIEMINKNLIYFFSDYINIIKSNQNQNQNQNQNSFFMVKYIIIKIIIIKASIFFICFS